MAIKFEKAGKKEVSIAIEGSVGIEDALEFYIRLKESLTGTRTLTIDLSAIENIDTSIIQLILVSKNEICGRGGNFNMVNPSAELIKTLNMAGLQDELGAA
ncbi:hypothetical protein MNBD_DELTA01-454 [hydrothermal vent metagenome]|uniref:STAS domain-containing protein n=1 Tax=hydrothermal vent metagenome TaxID=652676 RepID=A0A3B0R4H6_9ZZZZ